MIYVKDDFFIDERIVDIINDEQSEFQEVTVGDKSFWVKTPNEEFVRLVRRKIQNLESNDIEVIFSFFREAKEGQDNDWRIHNDSIINGQQPDRAAVLYISENNNEGLNGTAFWEHKVFGDKFVSEEAEEFNRMLIEESNEIRNWELKTVIGHKKNRLISYPCNYFHSKYPNEFIESRKVFVIFYKIKKKWK